MDLIINTDDFDEINEIYFKKNYELLEQMDILTDKSLNIYDEFGKNIIKDREQKERFLGFQEINNFSDFDLQIN